MKKQTFWKTIRCVDKSIRFDEAQGYVIDLTDSKGYTVKLALEYRRPSWVATHYESGFSLAPIFGKTKDELITKLKEVDFERVISKNTYMNEIARQLEEFKNNK